MSEKVKQLNTRIQDKYDTADRWKQSTFTSEKGEIYIYAEHDKDKGLTTSPRFKIGDGQKNVDALPFVGYAVEDTLATEFVPYPHMNNVVLDELNRKITWELPTDVSDYVGALEETVIIKNITRVPLNMYDGAHIQEGITPDTISITLTDEVATEFGYYKLFSKTDKGIWNNFEENTAKSTTTLVDKPTTNQLSNFSYNYSGKAQSPNIEQLSEAIQTNCTIDAIKQTNVGEYSAELKLNDNCRWSDGTTNPITFNWSITTASADIGSTTSKIEFNVDNKDTPVELKIDFGELDVAAHLEAKATKGLVNITDFDSNGNCEITSKGVGGQDTIIIYIKDDKKQNFKNSNVTFTINVNCLLDLNSYTWEQISNIAKSGNAHNIFNVGDVKKVVLDGSLKTMTTEGNLIEFDNEEFYVYILDFEYTDDTKLTSKGIYFGCFKKENSLGDLVDVAICDESGEGFCYCYSEDNKEIYIYKNVLQKEFIKIFADTGDSPKDYVVEYKEKKPAFEHELTSNNSNRMDYRTIQIDIESPFHTYTEKQLWGWDQQLSDAELLEGNEQFDYFSQSNNLTRYSCKNLSQSVKWVIGSIGVTGFQIDDDVDPDHVYEEFTWGYVSNTGSTTNHVGNNKTGNHQPIYAGICVYFKV